MAYSPGGIETLGAYIDTVLNTMTTKNAERVIQPRQTFVCRSVTSISEEAIGLKQSGWPYKPIGVPPERWAPRGTTGAQNAFVKPVQFLSVFG